MLRGYHGGVDKQIHYRKLAAIKESGKRPLVCLSPSPYSSLNYTSVMPLLNAERDVISVDYPGFGGSDPLQGEASIEAFANALWEFLKSIGPVDVMGFHTGTLIALELALDHSDLIGEAILIDIPYFDVQTRQKYHDMMIKPIPTPQTCDDLSASFEKEVTKRKDDIGLDRAYNMWVETLRSGDRHLSAFHAAFTYDCEGKFAALKEHVYVIATTSGLRDATLKAAQNLPQVTLVDCPEITKAVFELGKEKISKLILEVINRE